MSFSFITSYSEGPQLCGNVSKCCAVCLNPCYSAAISLFNREGFYLIRVGKELEIGIDIYFP